MTILTDVVGFQLDFTKSSVIGVAGSGGIYTPISGTGTGSTSFVALSDAANANIPVVNLPTAAALALLASLASPALTGTPTAPTPGSTDNSTKLATTAMVQAAIASALVGFLDLKGSMSAAANPNYPVALKGDTYLISAAGLIGGTSGLAVNVGDVIVASAANAGGTQAAVGTSWFVLEHQIAGALLATNNLSDVSNIATARLNLVLDQVNNTSDASKPVSTAQAAAIAARARAYRGVAASQTAMLALSASVVGDWCERSDLANQVFELTTAGPATLANWTAYPSGGVTTFAALTDAATATIAVTNTSVANALAGKTDSLTPTVLTVSTAITHAAHLNRPLSIAQAGATTMTFAVTATSGALAGDAFELLNTGAGTVTLGGTISAAAGYTLTIPTGVTASALYNAAADAFYSTTPSATGAGSLRTVTVIKQAVANVTAPVAASAYCLAAIPLPVLGPNARVDLDMRLIMTGTGTKSILAYLSTTASTPGASGVAGSAIWVNSGNITSQIEARLLTGFQNLNSQASQVGTNDNQNGAYGVSLLADRTAAVSTAGVTYLNIYATCGAADTAQLTTYSCIGYDPLGL